MKLNHVPVLTLGFLLAAFAAKADTFVPAWSAIDADNAIARCATPSNTTGLPAGEAVGYTTNTPTSQGTTFYIVACQRPDGNGGVTWVPAWSALSIANAQARCATPSNSTGLAAGIAVGDSITAQAESTNIYIAVCKRPDSQS